MIGCPFESCEWNPQIPFLIIYIIIKNKINHIKKIVQEGQRYFMYLKMFLKYKK